MTISEPAQRLALVRDADHSAPLAKGERLDPGTQGAPALALFVGMMPKLSRQGAHLFQRGGVQTYWLEHPEQALLVARLARPQLLVIDGTLLGPEPQKLVDALGAERVTVVGDPALRRMLSQRVEVLDSRLDRTTLLAELGERLGLLSRRHVRAECVAPVVLRYLGGTLQGMLENVSLGGAELLAEATVPVGTELELVFPVGQGERAEVRGRVVRATAAHLGHTPGFRLAVHFLGLDVAAARAIRSYVDTSAGESETGSVMAWTPRPLIPR